MYKPAEIEKHECSCPTPTSAQSIRDLLCRRVRFAAPELNHIEVWTPQDQPKRDSVYYTWGKEESRDLIESPKFYWEWLTVQLDENTHRCLSVQNSVQVAR